MRKILGITMGDPAGVGPEITVKALQDPKVYESCKPLVVGDAAILERPMRLSVAHGSLILSPTVWAGLSGNRRRSRNKGPPSGSSLKKRKQRNRLPG